MFMMINSSGGGIAGTLDANYYKGQGERQGAEREFVVIGETDEDELGWNAGSSNADRKE